MKKLLKYLTDGYMKETVLAPLFKCIEAVLELFVPLVVADIIDTGIGNGDKSYVMLMCAVLAGLGALGLAFSITAQYLSTKVMMYVSAYFGRAVVTGHMWFSIMSRSRSVSSREYMSSSPSWKPPFTRCQSLPMPLT